MNVKVLALSDPSVMVLGLQDEIRRSADPVHRRQGALQIAGGSVPDLGKCLNAVMTIRPSPQPRS
jgi:hypothetical protein